MRKFSLLACLALVVLSSCRKDLEYDAGLPIHSDGKSQVIITGDSVLNANTRATDGRIEFAGGYATGAGLYDGADNAIVQAVPYDGYQLVEFTGGSVDGNPNEFSGGNQYAFNIRYTDWKFEVTFKKEYQISVSVDGVGGIVSGGGTYLDGKTCTLTAIADDGYVFDGWYENSSRVSTSSTYNFTTSSDRTITCFSYAAKIPIKNKIIEKSFICFCFVNV